MQHESVEILNDSGAETDIFIHHSTAGTDVLPTGKSKKYYMQPSERIIVGGPSEGEGAKNRKVITTPGTGGKGVCIERVHPAGQETNMKRYLVSPGQADSEYLPDGKEIIITPRTD